MYPSEAAVNFLTPEEIAIIKSVRVLVGDRKTTVIEEAPGGDTCSNIVMDGSVYKLGNKGWPKKVLVSGTEYTSSIDPYVDNYELLVFSGSNVLQDGVSVIYDTFRFGDMEILEAYDYGGSSVLVGQCSLSAAQLTAPILNLAAAVVIIQGEFQRYAEEAVMMEDNDSIIDLSRRLQFLQKELDSLRGILEKAIKERLCCTTYSLPVIRVE